MHLHAFEDHTYAKSDSYLITTGCNIELQWEEHENISNDS